MRCFLLPQSIFSEIKNLTARFLCRGDVEQRSIHWMSRKRLTRHKNEGGLGFQYSLTSKTVVENPSE